MTLRLAVASVLTLGLAGCAHANLEGSDLDKVQHPAFVSRVADEAGPRVDVYRSDSTQASKLGATSPADADRKLEESLKPALSRFEAAERLRSHVHAAIQTERPWSQAIPPSQVASALETFLVQEVPGGSPDYGRLKPLGADAVVEFVIEEYGMRTEKGVPETWVKGTGRMFRLGDGGEMSLLDGVPAVATVRTLRRTSLLRLPPADLSAVLARYPAVRQHLEALRDARSEINARLPLTPDDEPLFVV